MVNLIRTCVEEIVETVKLGKREKKKNVEMEFPLFSEDVDNDNRRQV